MIAQKKQTAYVTGKATQKKNADKRMTAKQSATVVEEQVTEQKPELETTVVETLQHTVPVELKAETPQNAPVKAAKAEIKETADELPVFPKTEYAEVKSDMLKQIVDVKLTAGQLNEMIDGLKSATDKYKMQVHVLLALVTLQTIKFGEIIFARKLLQACGASPKGMSKTPIRTNAMKDWLLKFGPYAWDTAQLKDYATGQMIEAKGLVIDKLKLETLRKQYKRDPQKLEAELATTEFYVDKPEAEFKGFDFLKELTNLIKRAKKNEVDYKGYPTLNLNGLEAVSELLDVMQGKRKIEQVNESHKTAIESIAAPTLQ